MDGKSPLEQVLSDGEIQRRYDPAQISLVRFGSFMLPWDEYTTTLMNFPSTNCFKPYGEHGNFFLSVRLYSQGKEFARFHSECASDQSFIEISFSEFTEGYPRTEGVLLITDFSHQKDVPVELYFSNVHKKTGTYLAYPAVNYVGDQIYPTFHQNMLENTLFWPGIAATSTTETRIVVVNPYSVPMSYQISAYLPDGARHQSEVLRIRPYHVLEHSVAEVFPVEYELILKAHGEASLCVAAQYKVLAYATIRNIDTGIITTVDHLHAYQLV